MEIGNRRARHEYKILGTFEAGVVLGGGEVKALKEGRADISKGFVKIINREAWLLNVSIQDYGIHRAGDYDPKRPRKLLLHKKEIKSLSLEIKQKRLTLVPLSLYTKGRLIKAKIALAKGQKQYEKKQDRKRKDIERETEKELSGRY